MRIAKPARNLAAHQIVRSLVGQHSHLGIKQGQIEKLPFPRAFPVEEGGGNANDGVEAGENIGIGHAAFHGRPIRLAGDRHAAGHALDHEVIARPLGIGAVLAETGDRAIDELGVVIIPEAPGLFSALGLLWADLRADFSATVRRSLEPANTEVIQSQLNSLNAAADAWLVRERVPDVKRSLPGSADMRYPLQNYEINIPLPPGKIDAAWMKRASNAFHAAHERLYSHCDRESPVQMVNLRVSAIGRTDRIKLHKIAQGPVSPKQAQKGERRVHFQEIGKYIPTRIYERDLLLAGNRVAGPAVIEQSDSTIIIPPVWAAGVDAYGRLVMRAAKGARAKR